MDTWSTKLCDNHSTELVCTTMLLPCVQYGLNYQKYERMYVDAHSHCIAPVVTYFASHLLGSLYTTALIMLTGLPLSPDIPICIGSHIGQACYTTRLRRRVRDKYNIDGNIYEDFITHLLCHPCALCQENAQLNKGFELSIKNDMAGY
tara:strand:- start:41 stop:484 length:444 start_codon:yes stop_codon:yes gene_type:complete